MSSYAKLSIYVADPALRESVQTQVTTHNERNHKENPYPDAGFDLVVPETVEFKAWETKWVNFGIQCEMHEEGYTTNDLKKATGFYLYPRSSLSKTPLRLANSVGIIDSGYRNNLIAALQAVNAPSVLEKGTRAVQICHPSLLRLEVTLLDTESELTQTIRGKGGFGSTGK